MAWRFQPSKFKNAHPDLPKKEDTIYDLPIGNVSLRNYGIQCSLSQLAFLINGGKVGVLSNSARGKYSRNELAVLCAHGEELGDFTFLPFNDGLLATCSHSEPLKLWRVEESMFGKSVKTPLANIAIGDDFHLECLAAHPVASDLLSVCTDSFVGLVDIAATCLIAGLNMPKDGRVLCTRWSIDGKLLCITSGRGRQGYLLDLRINEPLVSTFVPHSDIGRESYSLFLGSDKILSSGFSASRRQEITVFDIRSMSSPEFVCERNQSTNVLLPLYDDDTKLIFLIGRGSTRLEMAQLQQASPIFSSLLDFNLSEQTLGACLAPKLCMDVMSCEVDRIYQLTTNSIIPLSCKVPRRSYRDFQPELFPDTIGPVASCNAVDWLSEMDLPPALVSLDPAKRNATQVENNVNVIENSASSEASHNVKEPPKSSTCQESVSHGEGLNQSSHADYFQKPVQDIKSEESTEIVKEVGSSSHWNGHVVSRKNNAPLRKTESERSRTRNSDPKFHRKKSDVSGAEGVHQSSSSPSITAADACQKGPSKGTEVTMRPCSADKSDVDRSAITRSIMGATSKFRHTQTIPGGPHGTFTNIRSVNTRLSNECTAFCVSSKYAAIPIAGPVGVVSVVGLSPVRRLPDGVIDCIQNHSGLTDFVWDPFNPNRLACALENGFIKFWVIPDEPVKLVSLVPIKEMQASYEKIVAIKFHPFASDVIAVACIGGTISIWDCLNTECRWKVLAHVGGILSMAWCFDGTKIVSVGRDQSLKVWLPRERTDCVIEHPGIIESVRSARAIFVCNGRFIILVHFQKTGCRAVTLLNSDSLEIIHSTDIDVSPQILVPYYDFDTSVLFLTSKGDRHITLFEVSTEFPYLLPLATSTFADSHKAISFHSKNVCDVKAVEYMRGWRLTERTMESISFRVPRIKKDLFQSDVFPTALNTWSPSCSAEDWFSGGTVGPNFVDICPEGMHRSMASPLAMIPGGTAQMKMVAKPQNKDLSANRSSSEMKETLQKQWSDKIAMESTIEHDEVQKSSDDDNDWKDALPELLPK